MARSDGVELGKDRLLDLHLLGDGLDDEVDVAELLAVLGGAVDAPEQGLPLLVGLLLGDLLLGHQAAELALRDLTGLLEALVDELLVDVLEHDWDVGGRDHLRDLAPHRAGADNGGFEHEHGCLEVL